MISCSSTFASSAPATSANVTFGVSPVSSFALDFPNEKAREPARLHLPEHEDPEADQHQPREQLHEHPEQPLPRAAARASARCAAPGSARTPR